MSTSQLNTSDQKHVAETTMSPESTDRKPDVRTLKNAVITVMKIPYPLIEGWAKAHEFQPTRVWQVYNKYRSTNIRNTIVHAILAMIVPTLVSWSVWTNTTLELPSGYKIGVYVASVIAAIISMLILASGREERSMRNIPTCDQMTISKLKGDYKNLLKALGLRKFQPHHFDYDPELEKVSRIAYESRTKLAAIFWRKLRERTRSTELEQKHLTTCNKFGFKDPVLEKEVEAKRNQIHADFTLMRSFNLSPDGLSFGQLFKMTGPTIESTQLCVWTS